ncbi:hypothetical protein PYCCODRAFT_90324 [Trametes coccinea BRFM310]|uniref:Uncharacterized protein n=1 Tax=Trametes coccinea (strain BRFM310) TaxID=1353009 RepID=A0A1Y2I8X9_TRAC3|nr:hypothetical protein PYCCODRAFT_90324 [Trametes coccinea BRFM310]
MSPPRGVAGRVVYEGVRGVTVLLCRLLLPYVVLLFLMLLFLCVSFRRSLWLLCRRLLARCTHLVTVVRIIPSSATITTTHILTVSTYVFMCILFVNKTELEGHWVQAWAVSLSWSYGMRKQQGIAIPRTTVT